MLAGIVSSWLDASDARRLARKKFLPVFPRLGSALVCSALVERSGDDRRDTAWRIRTSWYCGPQAQPILRLPTASDIFLNAGDLGQSMISLPMKEREKKKAASKEGMKLRYARHIGGCAVWQQRAQPSLRCMLRISPTATPRHTTSHHLKESSIARGAARSHCPPCPMQGVSPENCTHASRGDHGQKQPGAMLGLSQM